MRGAKASPTRPLEASRDPNVDEKEKGNFVAREQKLLLQDMEALLVRFMTHTASLQLTGLAVSFSHFRQPTRHCMKNMQNGPRRRAGLG